MNDKNISYDAKKIYHANNIMHKLAEELGLDLYSKVDERKHLLKYVLLDIDRHNAFDVIFDLDVYEPTDDTFVLIRNAITNGDLDGFPLKTIDVASLYPSTMFVIPPRHCGYSAAMAFIDELHGIEAYRKRKEKKVPQIERVIFNAPATIVFWKDGTKTVVKAQGDDEFDPEKGLAMAICKKSLGNERDYYEVFLKHVGRYEKQQRKAVVSIEISAPGNLAQGLKSVSEAFSQFANTAKQVAPHMPGDKHDS